MKKAFVLSDFVEDIELNGLRGRMVNAPAQNPAAKGVNILFVHGHHSSIERLAGVTELLSQYGNFCMPDLPGFGGMDHLYKIGLKPTIENLADYLAAFIKLQYGSRKKFVLVGYSMGFLVVTKMLQKYPELHKQVIDVISVAGFIHNQNLKFTPARKRFYYYASFFLGSKFISWIMREIFLRKWFLGTIYTRLHNAKDKFSGLSSTDFKAMVNFEVTLWRINHIPTWTFTTRQMFRADLTKSEHVPIDVIMVTVGKDRYFDSASTEQCMKVVYRKVKVLQAGVDNHGGSVVASAKDAEAYFPKNLRTHLVSLR